MGAGAGRSPAEVEQAACCVSNVMHAAGPVLRAQRYRRNWWCSGLLAPAMPQPPLANRRTTAFSTSPSNLARQSCPSLCCRSYQHFCRCGRTLDARLQALGGKQLAPRVRPPPACSFRPALLAWGCPPAVVLATCCRRRRCCTSCRAFMHAPGSPSRQVDVHREGRCQLHLLSFTQCG